MGHFNEFAGHGRTYGGGVADKALPKLGAKFTVTDYVKPAWRQTVKNPIQWSVDPRVRCARATAPRGSSRAPIFRAFAPRWSTSPPGVAARGSSSCITLWRAARRATG